jgi:hypothetical protein
MSIRYTSIGVEAAKEELCSTLPLEIQQSLIWHQSDDGQKFDYNIELDGQLEYEDKSDGIIEARNLLKSVWTPGIKIHCLIRKDKFFHNLKEQRYGLPLQTGWYEYTILYYKKA